MAGLAMFPREWTGVFAADETPPKRGYCIQNTAARSSGGVHWPLARPCERPDLRLVRPAEVRRSLWRRRAKERRNVLRADVPRVAVCAQGAGRWGCPVGLINFAGLCRLVCARRCVRRRSAWFWGSKSFFSNFFFQPPGGWGPGGGVLQLELFSYRKGENRGPLKF